MSKNSKNAKKLAKARDISMMHKNGQRGPKKTTKKHTKKNTWYSDRTGYYRRNEKTVSKKVKNDAATE